MDNPLQPGDESCGRFKPTAWKRCVSTDWDWKGCFFTIKKHPVCFTMIMIALAATGLVAFVAPNKVELGQIGNFISGVSLFFAAMGAWFVAANFTYETQERERHERFRKLYEAFWHTPNVSIVRRWIISSIEYENTLKPILVKRSSTKFNELDADDNSKLEC